MSQVWSELNKVVNASIPVVHGDSSGSTTDILNMESYNKCTFLIVMGATSADIPVVTVLSGADSTTCTTAIPFKYRTQINAVPEAAASDLPSALTAATTGGFSITTGSAGGVYIIEVDAADVAAGGTAFNHVALKVTPDGSTHAAHTYGVVAILSEPRYPQAILVTAID